MPQAFSIAPFAATLLRHAPVGVMCLDDNERVLWVNDALAHWLGRTSEACQDAADESLQHDLRRLAGPLDRLSLPATETRPLRWLQRSRDETSTHTSPITVWHFLDVTALHHLQEERDRLAEAAEGGAFCDPLTGLPNHRALLAGLDAQVSRSRRYHNPLSVILFKPTHLPGTDDEGQRAMLAIGQLLKEQMRWVDTVGRLANDEFLLILPETTADAARTLADKLALRIASLSPADAQGRHPATLCHSVAGWHKGDDANKLLRRVRDALSGTNANH